jgi:beta-lactamase class A
MKPRHALTSAVAAVVLGSATVPLVADPASAAVGTTSATCRSSSHPALAARLARDIDRALRDRISAVAVGVDDPGQALECWLNSSEHFDSASVVKVTILGALLRKAEDSTGT